MEIVHKVVLYSVIAFVVVGGVISLAGPETLTRIMTTVEQSIELAAADGRAGPADS